jgi:hypothetical protein
VGENRGVAHFGFRLKNFSALDAVIAKVKVKVKVEAAGGRNIRRGEY